MADYNKQTVAQLRQLLKDRGISSTGLQRKAQIVRKLEEADNNKEDAPESDGAQDAPVDDAPPDAIEEVAQAEEDGSAAEQLQVPGPEPSQAGESENSRKDPADIEQVLPQATLDAHRETVSHIDSDVPAPNRLKTIAGPAEDTIMDEIADAPQPVGVFIAAPADPEEVVGPRITEPPATEAEKPKVEKPDSEELPDAPGPAAEALRYAKERQLGDGAQAEPLQGSTRSSMAPGEKQSVEKPELLPIPEGSTAETSRLNSEELENDRKKRKRRSDSPDVPSQDIRAKKARSSQEPMPEVHLKEDAEFQDQVHSSPKTEAPSQRRERTDRYHTLVDSVDISTPHKPAQDRPIVPALHPATPALYIRGFMRPLRPEPLRAHLISLASSPSGSPDPSIITSLFLDAMKTHALVLFASTAAASRVRASLHGAVWPPEGNRKELWADFVPEDKVTNWIRQEEDAIGAEKEARANGRSIPSQRFEVIYPESSDGQVTAMFQQVGGSGPTDVQRGREASRDAHRRPSAHPLPTAPSRDTRQDIEQSFKTLDQLFCSTTAKPNLYYLPVADDISDLRLKELDNETSRDWAPGETRKGRGMKIEMKYKYTFDEHDRIVEVGEDKGPWTSEARGGRGGYGGFRGRGRGGRGASWRGREG